LTNTTTVRIKGDAGIDTDNNGTVDNNTYPMGYNAFYCYKYELSEQQYADFLNTLTTTQITTLGVAGIPLSDYVNGQVINSASVTLTNGEYFSSNPTKACGNSSANRVLAYADWSGLRPMTILEFNKASYGALLPVNGNAGYQAWGQGEAFNNANLYSYYGFLNNVGSYDNGSSSRLDSGATYYGMMDFTGNAVEPCVRLTSFTFTNINGNGTLGINGLTDIPTWTTQMIFYIDQMRNGYYTPSLFEYGGFRYVRSAE
jgi:hypothetical protein